ncbi:hypothetical protein EST62_04040 [Chlorobaculum sp. 24CR]|uniref:TolB family protein n=1 Tax=Chlorobaculum sp. 24CR TaxID=2508878 RepID=UPI00100A6B4E|nr:hypothetical protein [Chlorobaculum sp. 24CR]RXK88216.1 hypothetical protein EST62_04040 [Chlorobaculum sp. 24CR]
MSFDPVGLMAAEWYSVKNDHFRILCKERHRALVPEVIVYAETSLALLSRVFDYVPSEIITIVLKDSRDTGTASASVLPHNRITIDIAPFDTDYEFIRFDYQLRWIISHEMTHIVAGDRQGGAGGTLRSLLGKVEPSQREPLTAPFSLLTSAGRYTPTWHQEGIAVFMETWMNGGYGRVLGSFDEMYFRTLVNEKRAFMGKSQLDFEDDDSFLLGSTVYFYGARFASWLALTRGLDKLLAWYRVEPGQPGCCIGYEDAFRQVYGCGLDEAWAAFYRDERRFQQENIARIRRHPVTQTRRLAAPKGWVSKAYRDASGRWMFYASHKPHALARIEKLDLATGECVPVASLPTPQLVGVASTAFDREHGLFFFTTHNDRGYRDLWAVAVESGKKKLLLRDVRLGNMTLNPVDRALWGVAVRNGRAVLAVSRYPYRKLRVVTGLGAGEVLAHPEISPDGKTMAATLHRADGRQAIILIDLVRLERGGRVLYETATDQGNPEHPSWSVDGSAICWNATVSGVSNIFRRQLARPDAEALSNSVTGLFHPVALSADSLFCFEYTSEGFTPVAMPERPVSDLPAIRFFGQAVVERYPELRSWRMAEITPPFTPLSAEQRYHGFSSLQLNSLAPVVNAFQGTLVYGVYAELTDPLRYHRLTLQPGYSFADSEWHFAMSYEYRDLFKLELSRTPATFYDLLNHRSMQSDGWGAKAEYRTWWVYDRPSTLDQLFYVGLGNEISEGGSFATDETILTCGTKVTGQHLRKSIGSTDDEEGYQWQVAIENRQPTRHASSGRRVASGEAALLRMVLQPHQVVRLQVAAGHSWGDRFDAGTFWFGGFGNRIVEHDHPAGYRNAESFPGLSYRVFPADRYVKVGIENRFPPIALQQAAGTHYLSKADVTLFSQGLASSADGEASSFVNLGGQVNFYLKNFYLLDSTLSFGYARAWSLSGSGKSYDELFASLKLFRF